MLRDTDLPVENAELVVLVRPSGCGQSTLLRAIAGLDDVNAGQVLIGDLPVEDLPPAKRGIAMVFQPYALYPHMAVAANIALNVRLAAGPGGDRQRGRRSGAHGRRG